MLQILLLALILASPTILHSETGPLGFGPANFDSELESDRPDFTEATSSISPGHIQIESGYTYVSDKEDSHTLPELLVRVGIIEAYEIRIAWEGWNWIRDGNYNQSETANLNLGGKAELISEGDFLLSTILDMDLPTGSNESNQRGVEPAAKFLLSYDLSEDYSLGSNVNFTATHDDQHERILEYSHSLALGRGITDKIGAYLEYFSLIPHQSNPAGPSHYVDGGFTYLVNSNLQLDVRVGFGMNSRADDLFSGFGLVYRI